MDTDLVVRAQRGDKGAFALLATEIANRFLAVARRILRDLDLAEDATQQALLAIWQDLPQLRDPARFEAWSYRLLVRACYAEGRKERRWAPNLQLLPVDEPAADDGLSSVIDRDQLEHGFRRLSIDHRTVVVLHHYLDLPLERVAEIIGVPNETSRASSSRGSARTSTSLRIESWTTFSPCWTRRLSTDPGGRCEGAPKCTFSPSWCWRPPPWWSSPSSP
jgi:RNA polymerase sigma-70 factor (ECF subfamily)